MRFISTILFFTIVTVSIFSQSYTWELKQSGSSLGGPIDVFMTNTNVVYFGS